MGKSLIKLWIKCLSLEKLSWFGAIFNICLYFGGLLVKSQEISVDLKAREVGRLILTCAYPCVTQRTTTNRVRFERVRNNSHRLEQL